MKKLILMALLFATAAFTLPSCDSPREEAAEDRKEKAEDMEDAADDADNKPMEDAADKAGDKADNQE